MIAIYMEKMLQKISLLEVEQSQRQLKQENIKNRIEEQYHRSFSDLKIEYHQTDPSETLSDTPVEMMEAELSRMKDKIAKIVDVNLAAIKEYEQNKERYDFLSEQRDDLVQSVEDLHKVIAKINKVPSITS